MNEINLNSVAYKLAKGTKIIKQPISPWIAKIASGSKEYSDFSQANVEEWFDLRGGIGLERALPGESNRAWWLEGIDVAAPRGAVLGPLITTAGTFGAAPVKIIDFQDGTYGMSTNALSKWNAGTPAWDTVTDAAEIDKVLCVCDAAWDSEHAQVAVSADTGDKQEGTASAKMTLNGSVNADELLATEDITSIDISLKSTARLWIKSVVNRSAGDLELHMDDTEDCPSPIESLAIPALTANTWAQKTITLAAPSSDTAIISIGIYTTVGLNSGEHIWVDLVEAYEATSPTGRLDMAVVMDSTDEYLVLTNATRAFYSTDGSDFKDLAGCRGYLAIFDNRLCSIDTDGVTFRYSPVGDIDGTWLTFDLTEDMGTVYGMYQGKLLATGEPALFVHATRGWFTIDFYTQKVYRQEISYPPTTYAGHTGMYFNANHYIGTGAGIMKVAPNMATPVGPDLDDGLPSTYQGDVYDMIGVGNWIVYCVRNKGSSDKSSIFKRNTSLGGNLQVYTSAANTAITCLHHSPSSQYTNGRLWWGEGTSIKYCMFPDTTSNPKQISTYEYAAASATQGLILPKFRMLAAIKKVALSVSAITRSCDTDEYITVYEDIDVTGSWTSLGTFKTSPRPTPLTFPASDGGLGEEFYVIQLAVKMQRGDTKTNSPELESLMLAWKGKPVRLSSWTVMIDCTHEDGDADFTALEAIYDTATLVTFYPSGDTAKTSYSVSMSRMPQRFYHDQQGGKAGWIEITLEEIYKG